MHGYHGRFLEVDLTTRTCRDLPLSEDLCRKFIGGATLAAALVAERIRDGQDPLAQESPLVMATGPFTASPIPMVSRYAVGGVSPLTGYWGESTSGGSFPFRLKGSGYDGYLITGRADQPVYLSVRDGRAEIRDAAALMGLDTYQTQQAVKNELGDPNAGVACIGPAGEKQLKYAAIINDQGRAAGRCGLGALMGSKNLKAVAASGRMKPSLADPERVTALAKEAVATINGHLVAVALREYGTLMYMDMGMLLGDTPAKYYTQSVFAAGPVTGQALRRKYKVRNYACRGCPIGCGREINDFKDIGQVDGPEYETTAGFGPLCLNSDLDVVVEANHLCNQHGLDTISAAASIAYAMHLAEKGLLTPDVAGFEIKWGDGGVILKMLRMILAQEGLGIIMSQGTLAMARHFGRDEGEAAQVKGLEQPMHDGRAFHGLAVSYATGPRGACHLKGDYYNVDLGNMVLEYMILPGDRLVSAGKGEPAAKYQSLKDLYDALTICKFSPLSVTSLAAILGGITGWAVTPEELLAAGDRSVNIKRVVSVRQGVTRADDRLPTILTTPYPDGNAVGSRPDVELMLKEYYAYRGWDWETGRPTKAKLVELGLDEAARRMYP